MEELEIIYDIDGNSYKTVKIGNTVWTMENLKVTHYLNGDPIHQVQDPDDWINLTTGAWCYYSNNPELDKYGKLYNWYAVIDPRGLAPKNFHIPGDAEWSLLDYLSVVARGPDELIECFPCGSRENDGKCRGIGDYGFWWSATENTLKKAKYRFRSDHSCDVYRSACEKRNGMSVRCLKD